jgi:hypothetical protein
MADLGILNVTSSQLILPECGGECRDCPPIRVYDCAKALYRATGSAHTVVELCESCGAEPATTVKYSGVTAFKLCAKCSRLIGLIKKIH